MGRFPYVRRHGIGLTSPPTCRALAAHYDRRKPLGQQPEPTCAINDFLANLSHDRAPTRIEHQSQVDITQFYNCQYSNLYVGVERAYASLAAGNSSSVAAAVTVGSRGFGSGM